MPNTMKRNLQRGFGLSLLVLIISSVASYISIRQLSDQAELVNHTNVVIQKAEKAFSLLKDAESGQRGYLLTGSNTFLAPFINAKNEVFGVIDTLTYLTRDNEVQQKNCKQLRLLFERRFNKLEQLIHQQEAGIMIQGAQLLEGQQIMDNTREMIATVEGEERTLLVTRTQSFTFLSWLTPSILLLTALSAFLITIFFYRKVLGDYEVRLALQQSLEKNERETAARIEMIENIASQVSAGDYKVRVSDAEKDNLGRLGASLNKMAAALEESFEDLKKREWLKNGLALASEQMLGEKEINALSKNVIHNLADYTSSIAAAMYVCENSMFQLTASLGLEDTVKRSFNNSEGLIGKCADEKKLLHINNLPQNDVVVSHATGNIKPQHLVVFPAIWENDVKAVVELASVEPYSNAAIEFFETVASNIGLSIESAKQNARLQLLLSETQAQSEELQMQQHELEHLNADLEMQAQKLQVSEEELKVQQEELLQANQELEERSSMLEEKNQMIVERNLEIQKKAEELETTTKYKSEFLANMSHELRTPLNSILLLSRLLAENNEKNLTAEQEEFARVIQNSGNGLLTLIDEILDLSKIEAGKMKVEFRDVNVVEVSNNLTSLFAPLAKEKNLSFSVHIDENVPQSIVTDSLRLEQILKNLLSNAIKFTSRGSVTMQVKKNGQNQIQFSVVDTGIGIAEDKQHLVFEAFQQADGSTRRKYGGTGLGLSISRELAKLLGGEIALQSEVKKGSTFTLTIPVTAKAQPTTEEETISPSLAGLKPFQPAVKVQKIEASTDSQTVFDDRDNIQQGDKVILIVEDDTTFAQTLLSFAHQNNYKGLIATRGDVGVQLALQYLPTAILLDIKLPVKDGWQVMDELKNNAATRHIPVHMMSAMQAEEESLSRGAIDFIDKTLAFEKMPEVFNKIEQALQQGPNKILIIEENEKHAQALCYFLESYNINVKGTQEITEAATILKDGSADCVVLEMKVFSDNGYEALENIKNTDGLEQLPIIIFTGKSLSKGEEARIKQVADSIVVKTANSYKRILDEIDVFFQIVEENNPDKPKKATRRLSALESVLQNKTVLIADDDVRNIYSLTKALEAHKMTVISATDGKDALEQLKQNPKVNLILMDMMMPEMDGYEATHAIRQMPQYRNLPILAVTAKAMYGDREKCIQAGASDYISKPIDVDQLISLLRVWLYQ